VHAYHVTKVTRIIGDEPDLDIDHCAAADTALTFAAQAAPLDSEMTNMMPFLLLDIGLGTNINAASNNTFTVPLHWAAHYNGREMATIDTSDAFAKSNPSSLQSCNIPCYFLTRLVETIAEYAVHVKIQSRMCQTDSTYHNLAAQMCKDHQSNTIQGVSLSCQTTSLNTIYIRKKSTPPPA